MGRSLPAPECRGMLRAAPGPPLLLNRRNNFFQKPQQLNSRVRSQEAGRLPPRLLQQRGFAAPSLHHFSGAHKRGYGASCQPHLPGSQVARRRYGGELCSGWVCSERLLSVKQGRRGVCLPQRCHREA